MTLSLNQNIFLGGIQSVSSANQLSACFNDRKLCGSTQVQNETALAQIGSKLRAPFTVHFADTEVGVLVTKYLDHDWLERFADSSELIEPGLSSPLSLPVYMPDIIGEMKENNLTYSSGMKSTICVPLRTLTLERNKCCTIPKSAIPTVYPPIRNMMNVSLTALPPSTHLLLVFS
jgi:hypothetical protein